jgi:hypothetical protein
MTEQRFTIAISGGTIDDLHRRWRQTRWPNTVIDSGWMYGLDLDWMKSLADYWLNQEATQPLVAPIDGSPRLGHD